MLEPLVYPPEKALPLSRFFPIADLHASILLIADTLFRIEGVRTAP
jgi:hypothetical protein